MALMTATPSPVIVAPGSLGPTVIDWDSGSPKVRVKIFERRNVAGVFSAFSQRALTDPAVNGSYTISLHPGEVYEAIMFFVNSPVDPNDPHNEIDPLATVQVFALLPTPSKIITDGGLPGEQDVGGTFYARTVATGSDPTFATLQLGRTAPVPDAAGLLQIATPLSIFEQPQTTIHPFMVTPLDPGNLFFAVVRVHDSRGRWQQESYKFTTLRQTVKLQWQDLHIINASGNGFFRVSAFEGKTLFADMLNGVWFERITFDDGQIFDIMPQAAIVQTGPRVVGPANREIALLLEGWHYRSWPFGNDFTDSPFGLPQSLSIPFGKGTETVVNRSDLLFTQQGGGFSPGDFIFSIHVLVNVTYQP
jgi:hypothetical protein